jgi:hypothetical protein
VVALNQADLLSAEDAVQLLEDLRRLLGADGFSGVTTMVTSAVDLPTGMAQLRGHLIQAVAGRRAARRRLAADVDAVIEDLVDLVGPPVAADTADRAAFGELVDGLAEAAGVPAAAAAMETAYREQTGASLGSPLLGWLVRRRPADPAGSASLPPVNPATARKVAQLAVRNVTARAAAGLPPPWPDRLDHAGQSGLPGLPEALARALAAASERGADRTPPWWRLIIALQWLVAGGALVGLSWLAVGLVMRLVALPVTHPQVGPVPVPWLMLLGGLLAGGLIAVLAQPLLRLAARQARIRGRHELRAAVAQVGNDRVLAPVREVLRGYAEARAALHTAAGL